MARIGADSGWTLLLPGFVLGGIGIGLTPTLAGRCCCRALFSAIGMGLTNPALASTAVSVVPPERSGMASGTNSTFRQVGIATGIAGLGALLPEHDRLEADPARRHGSRARSRRGCRLGRVPAGDRAAGAGGVRRVARLDPHDRGDRRARRRGARRRAPAGRQAAAGPRASPSRRVRLEWSVTNHVENVVRSARTRIRLLRAGGLSSLRAGGVAPPSP